MPARTNWPSVSVKVAFTTGVFTETTLATTVGRALSVKTGRGRQYELGRSEAGRGQTVFDNADGRYTPTNGTGPYYGNLQLYRERKVEATWSATTYPVVRDFIERWPQEFTDEGAFGRSQVATVDAFAILAQTQLKTALIHEMLADGPTCLYTLGEDVGSTGAGDIVSPGVNPIAVRVDNKYGPGTVDFGTDMGLIDGMTGAKFTAVVPGDGYTPGTALAISNNSTSGPFVPAAGAFTIEMWLLMPPAPSATGNRVMQMCSSTQAQSIAMTIYSQASGLIQYLQFSGGSPAGGTYWNIQTSDIIDGQLHHIVGTLNADRKTAKLYVDGALSGSHASTNANTFDQLNYHTLGASILPTANVGGDPLQGAMAYYAVYPTELSAARVQAHYNAGKNAFPGEDSGARISRYLGYAGWSGTLSDIGTGSSLMGAALPTGSSCLEAIQKVADDELGVLWVSADGKVTFRGRQVRFTTTASSVTFGENTGAGEIPYLGDVNFDFDPEYVISEQSVSRVGGATVIARASSSVLPFLKSGTPREIGVQNDGEVTDQANWLIAQYSKPRTRVAKISVKPSHIQGAWPTALGTEINTRVTVKRRPLNQPVMSIDCWVEAIEHVITPTDWTVNYLLSPVDSPHAGLWDTDNWDDANAPWAF